MATKPAYKVTGIAVLVVGVLFFLRDIDPVQLNFIGNTSGWTIFIVLLGTALLASGGSKISKAARKAQQLSK